jgi:hypothetical protein
MVSELIVIMHFKFSKQIESQNINLYMNLQMKLNILLFASKAT